MLSTELKKHLIDKIRKTEDIHILKEVYRLLEPDAEDDIIYKLNDKQKKAIAEARNQVQSGQYLSEEQASEEIEKWLNG